MKMIFNTDDPDFLGDYDLKQRCGKTVKIIRPATKEEADIDLLGDMYVVEWEDGYTNLAMAWELSPCTA